MINEAAAIAPDRRRGSAAGESSVGSRSTAGFGRADIVTAAALCVAAFAVYAPLALRLAEGRYLDYFNLAFDFDPFRTVQTLALSPPDLQGFKHPLIVLLRPLAWLLVSFGLEPKPAAALEMVAFGSGTVAVCFLFLRVAGAARAEAAALTLLFALTGTQIYTSIIVESYGFSGFAIALIWLAALRRLNDPDRWRGMRLVAAVLTFGVTITNVVQPFIAELLVSWRHGGWTRAIRQTAGFALLLGAVGGLLAIAVWREHLWAAVLDPVSSLKEIWWLQTKGESTGLFKVLQTFFGYSFVTPHFSWLMLPEGINMRDFRDWSFSPVGSIAAPMWLLFWGAGALAASRQPSYRWIALGLAASTIFNVLFHLNFQFRGSIFIYAAHLHFAIFALGAGLAPWMASRPMRMRIAYIGVVVALACLVGANNLSGVTGFVTDFDLVNTPCPAPCANGM
jgi:MFS family permease